MDRWIVVAVGLGLLCITTGERPTRAEPPVVVAAAAAGLDGDQAAAGGGDKVAAAKPVPPKTRPPGKGPAAAPRGPVADLPLPPPADSPAPPGVLPKPIQAARKTPGPAKSAIRLVNGEADAATDKTAANPDHELPSLAFLQEKLEQLPKLEGLAPELRGAVKDHLDAALTARRELDLLLGRTQSFAEQLTAAKAAWECFPANRRLTQPTFSVDDLTDASVDKIQQRISEWETRLNDPRTGFAARKLEYKARVEQRRERLAQVPEEIAKAMRKLETEQVGDTPTEEPRLLAFALRWRQALELGLVEQEIEALRAEQEWCQADVVDDLWQAERAALQQDTEQLESALKAARQQLELARQREANQLLKEVKQQASTVDPRLASLAAVNQHLAEESQRQAADLSADAQHWERAQALQESLRKQFAEMEELVKTVGLTESIGLMLRRHRSNLPHRYELRREITRRADRIRQVRIRLLELEAAQTETQTLKPRDWFEWERQTANQSRNDNDPTSALASLAGRTNRPLSTSETAPSSTTDSPAVSADWSDELIPQVEQIQAKRTKLLHELHEVYSDTFQQLVKLDSVEHQLLNDVTDAVTYIDERVLWIRTGKLLSWEHCQRSWAAALQVFRPEFWRRLTNGLRDDIQKHQAMYGVAVLCGLGWLLMRRRWRGEMFRQGNLAAAADCRKLWPTWVVLVQTAILSLELPVILAFFAWRIDTALGEQRWMHALSSGLWQATWLVGTVSFLHRSCMINGLAESHFGWSRTLVSAARLHARWFLLTGGCLTAVLATLRTAADEPLLDGPGRWLMLGLGLAVLVVINRCWKHWQTAPMVDLSDPLPETLRLPTKKLERTIPPAATVAKSSLWMGALGWTLTLVPLGLIGLTVAGYAYTAGQLMERLGTSAALGFGLIMCRALIQRWIEMERRRIAVIESVEQRNLTESRQRKPLHPGAATFLFPHWFRLEFSGIAHQIRDLGDSLLAITAALGLWMIWVDVVPALSFLDRYPLWHAAVEAQVQTNNADGSLVVQAVKKLQPITVTNLAAALLIVGAVWVAARNLPGLIEVILLENLPVDSGMRFAISCLIRYAIIVAGTFAAFAQIGIGWSNVQWLVAAASVGLGFGLQEIFANFVSGIILLFERPMRVGDVITIGDTTGTVTRIRIRATTILDGDRKELIVPNKEFITGKLLNWTLSDTVNRVVVRVGVDFQADPSTVRQLLLSIAHDHPALLRDPKPAALLENFGDCTLNFVLCAFLPSLSDRQNVIHELHERILQRFRAEGINIPFPQRDLHIQVGASDRTGLDDALRRAGVA